MCGYTRMQGRPYSITALALNWTTESWMPAWAAAVAAPILKLLPEYPCVGIPICARPDRIPSTNLGLPSLKWKKGLKSHPPQHWVSYYDLHWTQYLPCCPSPLARTHQFLTISGKCGLVAPFSAIYMYLAVQGLSDTGQHLLQEAAPPAYIHSRWHSQVSTCHSESVWALTHTRHVI